MSLPSSSPQSVDGIRPPREFVLIFRFLSVVNFPNSEGIVPVSLFFWKYKFFRNAKSPSDVGIEPSRLFTLTAMYSKYEIDPMSCGMGPVREFTARFMVSKLVSFVTEDGMDPASLFVLSCSRSSWSRSPRDGDRVPTILSFTRLMRVTRKAVQRVPDHSPSSPVSSHTGVVGVPAPSHSQPEVIPLLTEKAAARSHIALSSTPPSATRSDANKATSSSSRERPMGARDHNAAGRSTQFISEYCGSCGMSAIMLKECNIDVL